MTDQRGWSDGREDVREAELDGMHVSGVDGRFSDAVNSDHPRCSNCQALTVGVDLILDQEGNVRDPDEGLCYGCRRIFERAEERALRAPERRELGPGIK